MKILVCIAQVPDTTSKIAFTNNNAEFNTQGVTMILNPYDEWYALVRALELKEAGKATDVHLITVGGADVEPTIRKALAIGGDEAIRIDADSKDPYQIAEYIAAYAKEGGYGLVLCGKESIDYNNGAVGAMLAELLDMEYIGGATKIEFDGSQLTVSREIEGGEEVDALSTPAVIACQKGVAEQRIPNMRGIMAARTKPLKVVAPSAVETLVHTVSFDLPAPKSGVKLFSADELDALVAALHNEAKVI